MPHSNYAMGRRAALVSLAKHAKAKDSEKSEGNAYAPLLAGLGTAGLAGLGAYAHMRHVTPTDSAYLQAVRDKAKDKFTHVVRFKERQDKLKQLWDKFYNFGGDDVIHTMTDAKDTVPNKAKKIEGAVRYTDSTANSAVKGDVDVGATKANSKLVDRLDDKWNEYNYLKKHAPGALGASENLAALSKRHKINPGTIKGRDKLQQILRKKYPNGFLLKETQGVQSAGMFPDETHDFNALFKSYKDTGQPKRIRDAEKNLVKVYGDDDIAMMRDLRTQPEYTGRVLHTLQKTPHEVIVQEKLPLSLSKSKIRKAMSDDSLTTEMRVHVEGGKVVPHLTSPRYGIAGRVLDRDHVQGAEAFAQSVVDKLPEKHRSTPFAMDVSPTDAGDYRLMESNATGNSGFLYKGSPLAGAFLRKHYLGNYSKPLAALGATAAGLGAGGVAAGATAALSGGGGGA